jgi:hypothetical protein
LLSSTLMRQSGLGGSSFIDPFTPSRLSPPWPLSKELKMVPPRSHRCIAARPRGHSRRDDLDP